MTTMTTMTTIYRHSHRVSLIPAMRSEASEPRRTLLPKAESTLASPLRLCVRLLLTSLLLILLPACGGETVVDGPDDPGFEEGIPNEVRITLCARSGNGTRAGEDGKPKPDGTPKDPVSSIELMHNWWIVFVDKNGNVKIIKDTEIPTADKIRSTPSTVDSPEGGFEAETFKTILPSGTYRIYAFANIPPKSESDFKDYLKTDSKGNWGHKTVKLFELIESGKISKDDMLWPDTENIPMTGVMTNKIIKNTVEEVFNIEVVRAVAKVEFAFSYSGTEPITLKQLEFSPISKFEKISFVPNNDSVGFGPNNKLITDKVDTGNLSFDINSTLTDVNKNFTFGFYCNESLPHDQKKYNDNQTTYENSKKYDDLYTGYFTIKLTVDKNGIPQDPRTLYTKKISYINRNDWIKIPIEFSDWKIYWKLRTYPPIGGLSHIHN